jgi:Icc-related predicted phosphoesterase
MNVAILSDLHLEFFGDRGASFLESLDPAGVDVLVVAGDLCTYRLLRFGIETLCTRYPEVVYVAGNHEYYHSGPGEVHEALTRLREELPNFHWLRNEVAEIAGARFAGTTLWFRYHPSNRPYEGGMNDFALIRNFDSWVYDENQRALQFLEREVARADVVVTHHLPSQRSVAAPFVGDPFNAFFVCEVDELIELAEPALWIHGHTHVSLDWSAGKTRVICNPFGYAIERNPFFDRELVVRIGG